MDFSRGLIVLICGIGLSCDATPDVTPPCPRPAFTLTPPLDTIGVGASVRYEQRLHLDGIVTWGPDGALGHPDHVNDVRVRQPNPGIVHVT